MCVCVEWKCGSHWDSARAVVRMMRLSNGSLVILKIGPFDKFVSGLFTPYGLCGGGVAFERRVFFDGVGEVDRSVEERRLLLLQNENPAVSITSSTGSGS